MEHGAGTATVARLLQALRIFVGLVVSRNSPISLCPCLEKVKLVRFQEKAKWWVGRASMPGVVLRYLCGPLGGRMESRGLAALPIYV